MRLSSHAMSWTRRVSPIYRNRSRAIAELAGHAFPVPVTDPSARARFVVGRCHTARSPIASQCGVTRRGGRGRTRGWHAAAVGTPQAARRSRPAPPSGPRSEVPSVPASPTATTGRLVFGLLALDTVLSVGLSLSDFAAPAHGDRSPLQAWSGVAWFLIAVIGVVQLRRRGARLGAPHLGPVPTASRLAPFGRVPRRAHPCRSSTTSTTSTAPRPWS